MSLTSVFTQAFCRPSFNPSNDLPDLTGKVAIVTGASAGLGKETARELARKGAHVFCIGRTVEKTKAAIDEIIKETGNNKVEFIQGDFMDLKSVEKAAGEFLEKNLPLHILVNNIGIMACPFEISKDGIESQFATNHFAPVVFTNRLIPCILKSQPSRIVNLASMAHYSAPSEGIIYDLLNDKEKYSTWARYGETKLANIWFTSVLQERLEQIGAKEVYVNCVHPGIVKTDLFVHMDQQKGTRISNWFMGKVMISVKNGALTQIYAAAASQIEKEGIKGKYFVPYCTVASPNKNGCDMNKARKMWDWTETILKEKFRSNWSFKEAGL